MGNTSSNDSLGMIWICLGCCAIAETIDDMERLNRHENGKEKNYENYKKLENVTND
jgi:hypothetical protein